jgi:hypothetical protein
VSDTLRDKAEKALFPCFTKDGMLSGQRVAMFRKAVDIAVEMVRRWGHVLNCECHLASDAMYPYRDSRCAPPEEKP